ncbi:MAG: hypothetical protein Q9170_002813 [Blastenia crenularia]
MTEEAAHRQDLLDLQAQQAAELAEQKERDLSARLESLSASIKKRKMVAGAPVKGALRAQKGGEKGRERQVSRGLEGFVFRAVKRRKVDREEEEDIDPELQELLSRVKGVGPKGGSVVKIF